MVGRHPRHQTGPMTSVETTWEQAPPQRWATVAAWATLACALPSALWRTLMIAGAMPGTEAMRQLHSGEGAYVIGLSVIQVLVAGLVIGLVRPWGERFLGIRIDRRFPVALGSVGGLTMTYLFTIAPVVGMLAGQRPDQGTIHGGALTLMLLAYAPMALFGPLTLAAVVGYAQRRRTPLGGATAQRAT